MNMAIMCTSMDSHAHAMRKEDRIMTIGDFVQLITSSGQRIDQLYVRNSSGDLTTAPGSTKYTEVKVYQYNGFVDLEFTI